MPIPTFQAVMLPLLRDFSTGDKLGQESVDAMAAHFRLTPEEIAVRLPSGKQSKFTNRVAWAKSHLKAAGLIQSPRRGVYRLTERGKQVLQSKPIEITLNFLDQFPEHAVFRGVTATNAAGVATAAPLGQATHGDDRTPDDLIEEGFSQLRTALVAELRDRVAHAAVVVRRTRRRSSEGHGVWWPARGCGDRRRSRR